MRELTTSSRHLSRLLEGLENNPQMLIFGRGGGTPGPGEAGFSATAIQGETK
jgi:phospholipid/cholesterol/gamma-HCH transport system substrate-binding protein